jgi:Putative porin
MRNFLLPTLWSILWVAGLLVAQPAWTQTTAILGEPAASVSRGSSDPDLRSEVEQLKQLVREQQRRIEALETQQGASAASGGAVAGSATVTGSLSVPLVDHVVAVNPLAPSAPGSPQTAPQQSNAQYSGSSDERIRNLERRIKGLGPISFSGDIRLRAEPFFGGPPDSSLDRVRGRVRARFNATADLGEQFRAGISLASGDINDPVSTNQTLTGFYTRKTIALDQAFVEFTPKQFKPLTLTGGKFRYPWYNTELTWDKDLNPEGAAETLTFPLETRVLKRIALVGFELPFAEMARTAAADKRIFQHITYGGQLQTAWAILPNVKLNAYAGYYNFQGADTIALALARASSKNPQTPLTGLLPLNSSSPVQNSMYTTTSNTVITIAGTSYPTGVSSVTNAQFSSKFGLLDTLARLDIDTGHARLPLTFLGDFVQNTEACANVVNLLSPPANTSTQTFTQTHNAVCDPRQRQGYWAEARIGRLQEKGDWQIGYTRMYIEREAVLGNFNYSELRQGTNVTQHRVDAFYLLEPNVQLGFTALIGRPLASTEPWLTRLQFDVIYIF